MEKCEKQIAEHEAYTEAYRKANDRLTTTLQRLHQCEDTSGNVDQLQDRLNTVQVRGQRSPEGHCS